GPIRTGVDRQPVFNTHAPLVFVFLMVQVNILILPVLVHSESDISVLATRRGFTGIYQATFFLTFLVIKHQARKSDSAPPGALEFIKSSRVGKCCPEHSTVLTNVDALSFDEPESLLL